MSSWQETLANLALNAGLTPRTDRFYFLRHGETDSNFGGLVQGWRDVPLNARGLQQADEAAAVLQGHPITRIIASPLLRAYRTAEIVAAKTGHAPIASEPDFREKAFGDWEGKLPPPESVWAVTEDNVESLADFTTRVIAGLNRHLIGGAPLIIAHGGVRRVLLGAFGLRGEAIHYGNAVPLEFIRLHDKWHFKVLSGA